MDSEAQIDAIRVSGIDGERVLRDEVAAVRGEWVEWEEMTGLVECQEKGDGEDSAGGTVTGVWEPYESWGFQS